MQGFARWTLLSAALAALLVGTTGCPPTNTPDGGDNGNDNSSTGNDNGGNDNSGTGSGDVSADAISFLGSAFGSVFGESATSSSLTQSARKPVAQEIADGATAWLTDLAGNRLLDADGKEYPNIDVGTDGSFELGELPVGVEIVLNVDVDGDGEADLFTIFSVPADDDSSETGEIDGIVCDPLSTLVYHKFRDLVDNTELGSLKALLSFAALIERTRDAFEHMFEDAGVDDVFTLDDILGKTPDELRDLFDGRIPEGAQRAIRMFRWNIDLASATDVEGVLKAAATILVQGGFIIADDPGGIDMSYLDSLPGVSILTFEEFGNGDGSGGGDSGQNASEFRPTLYYSRVTELDRNFVDQENGQNGPRGPIFREHILAQMAQLFLDGKTISVTDLYRLIVDNEIGMGARLAHPQPGRFEEGPPPMVFQTDDGEGVVLDMEELRMQIHEIDFDEFDPDSFEQHVADVRDIVMEFFADTREPTYEELFNEITLDRIGSVLEYARHVRDARAHVPFSRSGPAVMWVVATDDPHANPDAEAVTVDVTLNDRGQVEEFEYNAAGDGAFWLMFGPQTPDGGQLVGFANIETGRMLHDHRGVPQFLDLSDANVAKDVDGEPFYDTFSETGDFYPGAPALRVPNPGFNPEEPADPETNPPDFVAFVLTDEPGPSGEPVRVNVVEGMYIADPTGQYYVLFQEGTQETGEFQLIDQDGALYTDPESDSGEAVTVTPEEIEGVDVSAAPFSRVFGIEVPNSGYRADGAPYFDDIDEDGVEDAGEPTFSQWAFLNDPDNWQSTHIPSYYRRGDNGGFVTFNEVDFGSETPALLDGTPLVPRNFTARLNAFRFGRPNVTINLLTAFAPPEWFDGQHGLTDGTRLNPFAALALTNLVFDSVHNVIGSIDPDGPGPGDFRDILIDAELFVPPISDPVELMTDGIGLLAE